MPDDVHGVLQDVHWAEGIFGYFPTYALGNVIAGQVWARVTADLPDLDERFAAGDFAPLREWLAEHVHRFGRRYLPDRAARARDGRRRSIRRPTWPTSRPRCRHQQQLMS